MPDLNASIRIDAPVETVFAYVDDHRNVPKYLRGLVRWEPVDPSRAQGMGALFDVAFKAGPVTIDGRMEVVEHVPNERVAFRSAKGPKSHGVWTFAPDGDGTLVDVRNSFELPGGVAGRMVAKVVAVQGQRDINGSLQDLKRLIEDGEA